MRGKEPGTAAAAVALGVGLSAMAKSLGLGPMPPGLLQPLAPIAGVVGRIAAERAVRTTLLALLAFSPAIAWVADAPFDSGFDATDVLEGGTAAMAAFVRGIAFFLLVGAGAGVFLAIGRPTGTARSGRNATQMWIARACAVFKQHEAPRPSPVGGESRLPPGGSLHKSTGQPRTPRGRLRIWSTLSLAPFDLNRDARLYRAGLGWQHSKTCGASRSRSTRSSSPSRRCSSPRRVRLPCAKLPQR